MTEAEWLACDDPTKLLKGVKYRYSSFRRSRLFAVACCRLVWHHSWTNVGARPLKSPSGSQMGQQLRRNFGGRRGKIPMAFDLPAASSPSGTRRACRANRLAWRRLSGVSSASDIAGSRDRRRRAEAEAARGAGGIGRGGRGRSGRGVAAA
jgi:hypothetical protein